MGISIAIPFYNAEQFLANAIQSVFAQTYKDWELILIDDGSTDNSLGIANSIVDDRVRVISDGKNKKLARRLNEVTHLAKHEFIARMDADDLMSPNRLQKQLDLLLKNPDIDLVSTGMYSIMDDGTLVGYRGADATNVTFAELIKKEKGILHASILARKSWYLRNSYNEELPIAQDTDMWLRASKKNDLKIIIISDPLYIYREEQNIKASKMLKAYKLEREVFSTYIDDKTFRLKFIAKSYAKTVIIYALSKIGYLKFLYKRRNNTDSLSKYIEDYNLILENLKKAKF